MYARTDDTSWRDSQGSLADLVTQARSSILDGDEIPQAELQASKLSTGELLEQSQGILRELIAEVRGQVGKTVETSVSAVSVSTRQQQAWIDLGDLCSLVFSELDLKQRRLGRLPDICPKVTVLAAIEETREAIAQGLCAVERQLAQLASQPSKTQHVNLLRDALQARKASAKFQRAVFNIEAEESGIAKKLRSGATALVRLLGREEFRAHRVVDRYTAKKLHRDILEWAREQSGEIVAERLWSEVIAFATLVGDINQRHALRDHDRSVINQLMKALSSVDPASSCPAHVITLLYSIEGRDPVLDSLARSSATAGEILETLLPLAMGLDEPAAFFH